MPFHIELKNISWSTPDGTALLDDINLAFGAERTGLIGRNGIGKTTLLRIMVGETAPSSGSVILNGSLRMLHQRSGSPPRQTIAEAFAIDDDLECLQRIEAGQARDGDLENADWTAEPRAMAALADAGLPDIAIGRHLATLSGGQATRVALAALMFGEPDILLLDEPTNNLDQDGRAIVATMLGTWRGGAVAVSHDRALLRRMDRIVELSGLGARVLWRQLGFLRRTQGRGARLRRTPSVRRRTKPGQSQPGHSEGRRTQGAQRQPRPPESGWRRPAENVPRFQERKEPTVNGARHQRRGA